jgi:hypothetical protein
VTDADGATSREIFYGKLDMILQFNIPDDPFWGSMQGETWLLAVITPCDTKGKDAAESLTTYRTTTTQVVTDLRAISNVVGRVKTRNWWGIIDRSGDYSRTVFVDDDPNVPGVERK